MKFCIEVASVNYRERAVAGFDELWHANILWQSSLEFTAELATIAGKFETERSAKDNAIWFDGSGKGSETEENAFGDICPSFATGDFRDAFAVFGKFFAEMAELVFTKVYFCWDVVDKIFHGFLLK